MNSDVIYNLYLYNDSINSFERVIRSLTQALDWTIYQAEQCAMIAHEKERTVLLTGGYIDLYKHSRRLKAVGLTVAIERRNEQGFEDGKS